MIPLCEVVARTENYPRPLTALAIHNYIEPRHREVQTVLWYLADQAHVLQINRRNLCFLQRQGPGHHGPAPPRPGNPRPGLSPA